MMRAGRCGSSSWVTCVRVRWGRCWIRSFWAVAPRGPAVEESALHAATCAGAEDDGGRERLLRYVLRPPVAQERIQKTEQGLIRIALKKAWSDGTVAVELDPLSLLCRLAASVPPPKLHTVRYSGVLGSASRLRSRVVPTRR
jgi:hypothetical protein